MTLYMKKVWGYKAPSAPLQFSERGAMIAARETIGPDDRVVIVGTLGDETAPEDQGMLLGLMEVSGEPVSSLDYYLDKDFKSQDLDENGNYRWPHGLSVRRAWHFDEPRTRLSDVSDRSFGRQGAATITALTDEEAERILRLPRHEIGVRGVSHRVAIARGRRPGRSGPPPATSRAGVMHLRRASAFTYAMSIEGIAEPYFKIGWAFDVKLRENQFNLASLPGLGGVRYVTALIQYWPTAMEAFQLEQALLNQFVSLRHSHNAEVVGPLSMNDLQKIWTEFVFKKSRKKLQAANQPIQATV